MVVVDGTYEDAVRLAAEEGARPGAIELADVGASGPAHWVIDGYATLFAELDRRSTRSSCPSASGRSARPPPVRRGDGAAVIAVEPDVAACLTASLLAGEPTVVDTPGTAMAGLDCAEVSEAAWPTLKHGITGTVTVSEEQTAAAMRELAALGLAIGHSGAAALAGLHAAGELAHQARAGAADRHRGSDGPRGLPGRDRLNVRRNTLLLAVAMAVYSSVLQLVAAVSSLTFVLVTGDRGAARARPGDLPRRLRRSPRCRRGARWTASGRKPVIARRLRGRRGRLLRSPRSRRTSTRRRC